MDNDENISINKLNKIIIINKLRSASECHWSALDEKDKGYLKAQERNQSESTGT